MLQPNQRVSVDLSNLTIKGVHFSQNVQKALATVVQQVSSEPPVYLVELLFSFKGIRRVEVPEDRIHPRCRAPAAARGCRQRWPVASGTV